MDTKKRVIMALLVLSIVLSIFSIVVSLNAASMDAGKAPQSVNHIIRIQNGESGKVQLQIESAPEGENASGQ